MARFQSREEYDRWRAAQQGGTPAPAAAEGEAAPAEQVYDGPPPGSRRAGPPCFYRGKAAAGLLSRQLCQ